MELLILTGLSGGECGLVFFGIVVLMRWLMIGLVVSVLALLLVAVAVARHVRRQRRVLETESADSDRQKVQNRELDLALILHESDLRESKAPEPKEPKDLRSNEL